MMNENILNIENEEVISKCTGGAAANEEDAPIYKVGQKVIMKSGEHGIIADVRKADGKWYYFVDTGAKYSGTIITTADMIASDWI